MRLGMATPRNSRWMPIHQHAPNIMTRLAPNISASMPADHPPAAANRPYTVTNSEAWDEVNP